MNTSTRELILRNLKHVRGPEVLDGPVWTASFKSVLSPTANLSPGIRLPPGIPLWEVTLRSPVTAKVVTQVSYLPLAHDGLPYWFCQKCRHSSVMEEPCPHVVFVAKSALGTLCDRHPYEVDAPDIDGLTWSVDRPYTHKRYHWQNSEWVFVVRDVAGTAWRLHARNKVSGGGLTLKPDQHRGVDGLDGLRSLFAAAYRKVLSREHGHGHDDQWASTRDYAEVFDSLFEGVWVG
jgi:hypothetical protein